MSALFCISTFCGEEERDKSFVRCWKVSKTQNPGWKVLELIWIFMHAEWFVGIRHRMSVCVATNLSVHHQSLRRCVCTVGKSQNGLDESQKQLLSNSMRWLVWRANKWHVQHLYTFQCRVHALEFTEHRCQLRVVRCTFVGKLLVEFTCKLSFHFNFLGWQGIVQMIRVSFNLFLQLLTKTLLSFGFDSENLI